MFKSSFIKDLHERGLIHDATDLESLDVHFDSPQSVYIGFDPTADSLHVGSLQQLMILRIAAQHGHTPVALVGGATALIGDPSFRDSARPYMDNETLSRNVIGITKVVKSILGDDAVILNNADWFNGMGFLHVLREFGPHFSVNRMLGFDSIKTRLERDQGLSFLEFNYSILQSVDFLHMNTHNNVTVQIGGSDQWSNIIQGVELVRKKELRQVFGLTTPLLLNASGEKMGKTSSGAVWLTKDKTSPFDFFQFWRNIDDTTLPTVSKRFLKEDVDFTSASTINEAKDKLASALTVMVHGPDELVKVKEQLAILFKNASDESLQEKKVTIENPKVLDIISSTGFFKSRGEIRKMIKAGDNITLDGERVTEDQLQENVTGNNFIVGKGRKNKVRIVLE